LLYGEPEIRKFKYMPLKKWCMGFLFSPNLNMVTLIRKSRPEFMAGKLNGVGGHIEESDLSPYAAMVREFKEEAGLDIAQWLAFGELIVSNMGTVYLFAASSPLSVGSVSVTEEVVGQYHIDSLDEYETMAVVPWMVQLARVRLKRRPKVEAKYYIIHET
jgi:8-oxo-dGTP pyrophosphatase MutT (NUDIX family)